VGMEFGGIGKTITIVPLEGFLDGNGGINFQLNDRHLGRMDVPIND
jgi:hypothetical protein